MHFISTNCAYIGCIQSPIKNKSVLSLDSLEEKHTWINNNKINGGVGMSGRKKDRHLTYLNLCFPILKMHLKSLLKILYCDLEDVCF